MMIFVPGRNWGPPESPKHVPPVRAFAETETDVPAGIPEGLAKAREFRPDLVLCDIGLPGMDGYTVARLFRADDELKHAHLVAVSGYALPEDLQRAAEAGFERHIAKPPTLEKIEKVVREVR